MAEENTNANIDTSVANHSAAQAHVDMTMADGKQAKPAEGPTAESLGVSEQQFQKYYSPTSGYNWEAHAKEQEFIAQQKQEKGSEAEDSGDQSKATEAEAEKADEETKVEPIEEVTDENVGEILAKAHLDPMTMKQKIEKVGDLDDEDYEALKKIGVSEATANNYVQSVFDRAQSHVDKVVEMFGGEKALKDHVDALDLSDAEKAKLAESLANPDSGLVVARGLLAKSQPAGRQRGEQGGSATNTAGYASQAEQVAAQRDPRYKKDPAYRAEVIRKISMSNFGDVSGRHTSGL